MATTDLGKWMITNGGEYNPDTTYEQLTMVLYQNSTYITLRTVTGIIPNNDKINYILMAQGFSANALADVVAKDTYGVIGDVSGDVSAQNLVDYLTNEVVNNLLKKTSISTVQTNSDNTVPSSSLAYVMQQEITKNKEDIATANSNLEKLDSNLELLYSSDSLAIATQDIMLPHDFSTYKIIIIYLAINYNGSILHFSDFVIRLPTDTKITSNFTLSSYFNNTGFLSIRCSLFNNLLQIKEISAGTSWSGQKMALYVYGK